MTSRTLFATEANAHRKEKRAERPFFPFFATSPFPQTSAQRGRRGRERNTAEEAASAPIPPPPFLRPWVSVAPSVRFSIATGRERERGGEGIKICDSPSEVTQSQEGGDRGDESGGFDNFERPTCGGLEEAKGRGAARGNNCLRSQICVWRIREPK